MVATVIAILGSFQNDYADRPTDGHEALASGPESGRCESGLKALDAPSERPVLRVRREDRRCAAIPARLRHSVNCRSDIRVTDLSAHGCRISTAGGNLAVGSHVFVGLDHLGPIRAHVRWCDQDIAGLEFDGSLHVAVLDHLLARWPRFGSTQSLTSRRVRFRK